MASKADGNFNWFSITVFAMWIATTTWGRPLWMQLVYVVALAVVNGVVYYVLRER